MARPRLLWTAEDATAATGGQTTKSWAAGGVSIDSRTLEAGDLFVAVAGESRDGHSFVADAFRKGAAAAVVTHVPDGVSPDSPLLIVRDTLTALRALATAARNRANAKIVAVTGSVGKTGTKEALRAALSRQGRTHASIASYNNMWGVPLSLARMPADTEYAVFEIGMNHAGEIAPLARLVFPDVAIITTIAPTHLEFFDSIDAIADAKAEIFEGLDGSGIAILNRDIPQYERLAAAAERQGVGRLVTFGRHDGADARLIRDVAHPHCTCVAAEILGQAVTFKIGLPGRHWAMNSLAVLAAVASLEADLTLAALALAELEPLSGRGRIHQVNIRGGEFQVIDESYNASPPSMRAAFEALSTVEAGRGGRRIAVLGDMLELGDEAARFHRELEPVLDQYRIDIVHTTGPNMEGLHRALPAKRRGTHAESSRALINHVIEDVRPGDVLMVKGSLGSRMGVVVEALLALDEDRDSEQGRNSAL